MTEDRIFEKMARAASIAEGMDPDELVIFDIIDGPYEERFAPYWETNLLAAKIQYAAHKAMIEAMGDEA